MAKKVTSPTAEPLLNGKLLKNNTYAELKAYALKLEINVKALPKQNENNFIKAIKEKLASVEKSIPEFDQLTDKSLTFKINYAVHHKVPKEVVIEKLNITPKRYVDVSWLYENNNYKQKVIDYLEELKSPKKPAA
jgi:predicted secreted protein